MVCVVPKPAPILRWSDTATWGGSLPANSENVTIPVGQTILLDVTTANLGVLTINGTLRVDLAVASLQLSAQGILINVGGRFECGSAPTPHPGRFIIELTGVRPAGAIVGASHDTNNVSTGNPNDAFMGTNGLSRGIINMGEWEFWAATPTLTRTQLAGAAAAGASSFTLKESVTGWASGSDVMVGPTGFYGNQHAELFTLANAVSGTSMTTSQTLAVARSGQLQYLTDTGISATAGTFSTKRANASQRSSFDQRAKVAVLNRGITIQGANDAEWTTNRFGVHTMTMDINGMQVLEGVEFLRCGQGGLLGRYPIHWHMLSYNANGTTIGAADPGRHRVRNCVIRQSQNRGITIHGTRGVKVVENVCHDVKGHNLFLEDGSEEDNIIESNWFSGARDPGTGFRIKLHDASPAGAWLTNANNQLRYNSFFDNESRGLWNVFQYAKKYKIGATFTTGTPGVVNWTAHTLAAGTPLIYTTTGTTATGLVDDGVYYVAAAGLNTDNFQLAATPGGAAIAITAAGSGTHTFSTGGCFGASGMVPIIPFFTPPKMDIDGITPLYDDNENHSNGTTGAETNNAAIDEQGTTRDSSAPSGAADINGPDFKSPANRGGTRVLGRFSRMFNWKNQKGGYQNRVVNPHYSDWVNADNLGTDFFGATLQGVGGKVTAPVLVHTSLNTETAPSGMPNIRNCFASYHTSLDFIDVSAFGYALSTPTVATNNLPYNTYGLLLADAVLQTWDLYTQPIFMEFGRDTNWKLFNSEALYRTPPPHLINDLWDTWTGNQPMDVSGSLIRRWTIAGAMYDHANVWGFGADRYIIFNHPYYTYGVSGLTTHASPRMTCDTASPIYGIKPLGDDAGDVGFNAYTTQVTFQRTDSSRVDQSGALLDLPNSTTSSFFNSMRHAVCPYGGYVKIALPEKGVQGTYLRYSIWNCSRVNGVDGETQTDVFYLALPWSNSVPARVFASVGLNGSLEYNSDWPGIHRAIEYAANTTSFASLQSGATLAYWQDTTNNLLWVKVGSHSELWTGWTDPVTESNRTFDLVVKPA
jgi:hypothetical protein